MHFDLIDVLNVEVEDSSYSGTHFVLSQVVLVPRFKKLQREEKTQYETVCMHVSLQIQ